MTTVKQHQMLGRCFLALSPLVLNACILTLLALSDPSQMTTATGPSSSFIVISFFVRAIIIILILIFRVICPKVVLGVRILIICIDTIAIFVLAIKVVLHPLSIVLPNHQPCRNARRHLFNAERLSHEAVVDIASVCRFVNLHQIGKRIPRQLKLAPRVIVTAGLAFTSRVCFHDDVMRRLVLVPTQRKRVANFIARLRSEYNGDAIAVNGVTIAVLDVDLFRRRKDGTVYAFEDEIAQRSASFPAVCFEVKRVYGSGIPLPFYVDDLRS